MDPSLPPAMPHLPQGWISQLWSPGPCLLGGGVGLVGAAALCWPIHSSSASRERPHPGRERATLRLKEGHQLSPALGVGVHPFLPTEQLLPEGGGPGERGKAPERRGAGGRGAQPGEPRRRWLWGRGSSGRASAPFPPTLSPRRRAAAVPGPPALPRDRCRPNAHFLPASESSSTPSPRGRLVLSQRPPLPLPAARPLPGGALRPDGPGHPAGDFPRALPPLPALARLGGGFKERMPPESTGTSCSEAERGQQRREAGPLRARARVGSALRASAGRWLPSRCAASWPAEVA